MDSFSDAGQIFWEAGEVFFLFLLRQYQIFSLILTREQENLNKGRQENVHTFFKYIFKLSSSFWFCLFLLFTISPFGSNMTNYLFRAAPIKMCLFCIIERAVRRNVEIWTKVYCLSKVWLNIPFCINTRQDRPLKGWKEQTNKDTANLQKHNIQSQKAIYKAIS